MSHRMKSPLAGILGAACLVTAAACSKAPGTVERKSDTTTQTAQGEVKTTSESTQVGNTLEAKTETKADTANGTIKGTVETVVGTVTSYEPGKKIEVLTADKTKRDFRPGREGHGRFDRLGRGRRVAGEAHGAHGRRPRQAPDDQARRLRECPS